MDDVTYLILRFATVVIAAIIAKYLIPALKTVVNKEFDEGLDGIINVAVYAAQQTIKDNTEKKQWVMEQVRSWLNERGVEISTDQLSMLIESAVLTMKMEMEKDK